jgi:hypothetical protein
MQGPLSANSGHWPPGDPFPVGFVKPQGFSAVSSRNLEMKISLRLLGCLLVSGCTTTMPPLATVPSPHLLLFAADKDGTEEDFFAVVDVRPSSPTAGSVIATTPFGHRNSMPHHMEYELPPGGTLLFANAHHPEETMLVDVGDAPAIRIVKSISPPEPLRFPHDYARLPSGNVLMGFLRSEGAKAEDTVGGHGGIAEYTAAGELLRSASAAVAGYPAPIRVYAILPLLDLDRIVTTSARMMEKHSANVIQVWRYSDLTLLETIDVPAGRKSDGTPLDWAAEMPFGPRRMQDGSVLLNSYMCGFYRLTELASDAPKITHVYDIQGRDSANPYGRVGCSVPVVIGTHWIMPVAWSQMLVVLDVADPAAPRELSRLLLPDDFNAHWAAKDPGSNRIVVGAEMEKERGMYMLAYDPGSATLSIDLSISARSQRPGYIDLDQQAWPHGASGGARAHSALFLPLTSH